MSFISLNHQVGSNWRPMSLEEMVAMARQTLIACEIEDGYEPKDIHGYRPKDYTPKYCNELVSYYWMKLPSHNYWHLHRAIQVCERMNFDVVTMVMDMVKHQFDYKDYNRFDFCESRR